MPSNIITKSLYNQLNRESENIGKYFIISHRISIIKMCYKHGIKKTAKLFSISRNTIYLWIKSFMKEGIAGLENKTKHKGGLIIQNIHKDAIKNIIKQNPNLTVKEIKYYLQEKFNISVSISTIYNHIKDLGFSYISSRQKHYKQDKEEMNKFKKKLYQK